MFPCVFAGSLMEPVEDYLLLRMRLSGYAGRICCCQLKTASFLVWLKCQTGSVMWWLNSGLIHKNIMLEEIQGTHQKMPAGGSQLEQLWLRQAGIHGPGWVVVFPGASWSQDCRFHRLLLFHANSSSELDSLLVLGLWSKLAPHGGQNSSALDHSGKDGRDNPSTRQFHQQGFHN